MRGDTKNPAFANKLDKLLEEYLQKRRLTDEVAGDIYMNEQKNPTTERIKCRFRDNCYTLNSNMGDCPCGLNEE